MKQHIFKQYIGQGRNHKENQKVSQVEWRVMFIFIFKSKMTKCPTSWETPENESHSFTPSWETPESESPTLCDSMDYIVHVILQARILEWVAFPFSSGSSHPRDWTQVYPHCRRILYQLSYQGSPSPRPTRTFGHPQKYLGSNSKLCVTLDMWLLSVFFLLLSIIEI